MDYINFNNFKYEYYDLVEENKENALEYKDLKLIQKLILNIFFKNIFIESIQTWDFDINCEKINKFQKILLNLFF